MELWQFQIRVILTFEGKLEELTMWVYDHRCVESLSKGVIHTFHGEIPVEIHVIERITSRLVEE